MRRRRKGLSIPKVIYLCKLPEEGYRLKRSLAVFLEEGKRGWLASRDDLGICCFGETIDDALTNFAKALLDDYDTYVGKRRLTAGARKLAKRLSEIVEVKD